MSVFVSLSDKPLQPASRCLQNFLRVKIERSNWNSFFSALIFVTSLGWHWSEIRRSLIIRTSNHPCVFQLFHSCIQRRKLWKLRNDGRLGNFSADDTKLLNRNLNLYWSSNVKKGQNRKKCQFFLLPHNHTILWTQLKPEFILELKKSNNEKSKTNQFQNHTKLWRKKINFMSKSQKLWDIQF